MNAEDIKQSDLNDRLLLWSFCAMFFFLPIATSPAVISGMISLGIWVFSGQLMRDRHEWTKQAWFKPVVLLILLPWIGLLWTDDIHSGLRFAKKSYYWLYAFAILSVCHIYSPKILINSFLAGLSLTVIISMLQYVEVIPMPKGYPAGFMGHIVYSLLLVYGILLLSFYYREAKLKKHRVAIMVLIAAYVFSLSVNTGRIGYFAFAFLSPWILYNLLGRKHIIIFVVSVSALIMLLSLSPTVQNRSKIAVDEIKEYYNGDKNTSIGRRFHMWEGAIKMFMENPVMGVGTGGYAIEMKKYRDAPDLPEYFSHPHNSFLYMATSYGIIGLVIFIWLLAVFFRKGWRARTTMEGFSILSFGAVLLIGSMTDTQMMSLTTGNIFALLVGLRSKG